MHIKGRNCDIYGAGVGDGLAWDASPPPRRDESRGYAHSYAIILRPKGEGYLPTLKRKWAISPS